MKPTPEQRRLGGLLLRAGCRIHGAGSITTNSIIDANREQAETLRRAIRA